MKRFTILLTLLVCTTAMFAEFNYSGNMRTRMGLWNNIGVEPASNSNIDTRLRMKFEKIVSKDLQAVVQFEMGDFAWGDGDNADIGTDGKNIELKHAYMKFACPYADGYAKVGLQYWGDKHGLVLDDDFAGLMINRKLNMLDLQFGFGKADEGYVDKDDDLDLFFINGDMDQRFGMQNIFARYNGGDYHAWLMPYANLDIPSLATIKTVLALNIGNRESMVLNETSGEYEDTDISNFGWAFSLKANTQNLPVNFGLDVLMTSSDDGSDAESTSVFYVISDWYINGLEYMGNGVHDGINGGWDHVCGYGNAGKFDIVVTANADLNEKVNVNAAFGLLNTVEEVQGETNKGMEFDLGASTKIQKNVSLNFVSAFFMPNKDMLGTDDVIKEIATVLSVKF